MLLTKHLTINTDNCATTYYRHFAVVKTDVPLLMYTRGRAFPDCTPLRRPFQDPRQ
jgi:hypothetical protein